jgi:hypothetical protein
MSLHDKDAGEDMMREGYVFRDNINGAIDCETDGQVSIWQMALVKTHIQPKIFSFHCRRERTSCAVSAPWLVLSAQA